MGIKLATADLDERVGTTASIERDRSWQTVVWNDPVNLMSYVVHVFKSYFGYSQSEANRLMLAVHHDGFAVVAEGAREVMELHAHSMHDYGLWATVRRSPQ
ncbi:ATP-dependent Clp protease adaptor protein ClpS [Microbacterium endophyticum]|uniref:ATP-dependent Clp protease adapter protein ClpS n=1 Tax=Microbacterium endophyticum TaxID=1526412 RepID=A0A7W4YLL6_9MICO|nr:ATP-dependent Clp protease adapter ClpS [Microbacterium endophyticum]MBB2974589.1 ATP-dependent Clp protease adaptor protein ClpS [Microbacterium endophyticum]NIK36886.1 ATP-dependent Clp protease adaptor protein ClpS [Microbacterium endophyticum]